MKGVKGKLMKKLMTVKSMGLEHSYLLKPETILLQVNLNAIQGYFNSSFSKLAIARDPFAVIHQQHRPEKPEQEEEENLFPPEITDDPIKYIQEEFEEKENRKIRGRARDDGENEESLPSPATKTRKVEEDDNHPQLHEFPVRCPPGGSDAVILYTTSLRGIRKTFDDCQKVRSLLENMRVLFVERDLSMHSEFKQELLRTLEKKVLPPKLFIKGRYIGGADEVVGLHERGHFRPLIQGVPVVANEIPCEGCAGIKFIICFNCHGSRKIPVQCGGGGSAGERETCPHCNENGILICPNCC